MESVKWVQHIEHAFRRAHYQEFSSEGIKSIVQIIQYPLRNSVWSLIRAINDEEATLRYRISRGARLVSDQTASFPSLGSSRGPGRVTRMTQSVTPTEGQPRCPLRARDNTRGRNAVLCFSSLSLSRRNKKPSRGSQVEDTGARKPAFVRCRTDTSWPHRGQRKMDEPREGETEERRDSPREPTKKSRE